MPRPNHRDPESDLSAALGEELRRLRALAGYATQDPLAKALGYGREQVSKIETGYELPSDALFSRWLDLCQASDQDRYYLDRSLRQARRARAATPAFARPWRDAQQAAEYLLLWSPVLVPGPLQVREYAIAVFIAADFSEEEAITKAEDRLAGQSILTGDDPVHVTAVIHDSVLDREVGSPEAMRLQLGHLLAMSELPDVIIQVVRGSKYFFGLEGPFYIATGDAIPDTLVMVAAVEDQNSQEKTNLREATKLFRQIQSRALNVEGSRTQIREALERWSQQQ
jgi:transcriptional regulator with XRE-family HTH domain